MAKELSQSYFILMKTNLNILSLTTAGAFISINVEILSQVKNSQQISTVMNIFNGILTGRKFLLRTENVAIQ